MLKATNISVTYPNGVQALKDARFNLPEASLCGIIGPNGGGKTTLLKGLLGLVPGTGKVSFHGKPIKTFAKKTAYVEQKRAIDMDFPITVFQCVLLGTYPSLGLFKRPGVNEKKKTLEALEKVGLADLKERQIGELSGGQFQRVLIARTLAQNPDLVFLDEPFVGIDVNSEAIIIKLLKKMVSEKKTILIVHHDLNKIRRYFDHLIMINKTVIAAGTVEKVYTKENMKKTFNAHNNPLFS